MRLHARRKRGWTMRRLRGVRAGPGGVGTRRTCGEHVAQRSQRLLLRHPDLGHSAERAVQIFVDLAGSRRCALRLLLLEQRIVVAGVAGCSAEPPQGSALVGRYAPPH